MVLSIGELAKVNGLYGLVVVSVDTATCMYDLAEEVLATVYNDTDSITPRSAIGRRFDDVTNHA